MPGSGQPQFSKEFRINLNRNTTGKNRKENKYRKRRILAKTIDRTDKTTINKSK